MIHPHLVWDESGVMSTESTKYLKALKETDRLTAYKLTLTFNANPPFGVDSAVMTISGLWAVCVT